MNKRFLAPAILTAGAVLVGVNSTGPVLAATKARFTFENILTQQNELSRGPVKKKKPFVFLAKKAKVSTPKSSTVTASGKSAVNGANIPWKTYSGTAQSFIGELEDARCLALPVYSLIAALGVPDLCIAGAAEKLASTGEQFGLYSIAGQAWSDPEFVGRQVYVAIGLAGKVTGLRLASLDGSALPVTPFALPAESQLQAWAAVVPAGTRFDRFWTVDGVEEREPAPDVVVDPRGVANSSWTDGLTEIKTGNVLGEVQWITARAGTEFKIGIFYGKTSALDVNYPPDLWGRLTDEKTRPNSNEFEYGVGGTGVSFSNRIKDVSSHVLPASLGATSLEFVGLPPKAKGVAKLISLGPDATRQFVPVVVYDYRGPYALIAKNAAGVEVARVEN